jgi:16S rRNA (uracil1498-N3)-methyltransferase
MRLHRFYVEEKIGERTDASVASPELIHQWRKVFRLGEGDKVVLFDGSGIEYECEIKNLSRHDADLTIVETRTVANVPKRDIALVPSLVKKDKIEWVVEKGTELGAGAFAPVISERSEKKGFDSDRARKIAKEASEQSGRGTIPTIHEAYPLKDAIDALEVKFLALDPGGEPLNTEKLPAAPLGILIGPEGGWTDGELELFREKNIEICSLGKQILRAETAAIAGSSLLLL